MAYHSMASIFYGKFRMETSDKIFHVYGVFFIFIAKVIKIKKKDRLKQATRSMTHNSISSKRVYVVYVKEDLRKLLFRYTPL